jgi:hypothetical protein
VAHKIIPIPDTQANTDWQIASTDDVYFQFNKDIDHFEVDHPGHFKPKVPSGRFHQGDKIGPYTPNTKNKKVAFTYSPDATLAAQSHTILIGN